MTIRLAGYTFVKVHGRESRAGSLTAEWAHFAEWKKVNSEGEEGAISLDTTIRGICPPARLLDIVENFMLFAEARGGLAKLVAAAAPTPASMLRLLMSMTFPPVFVGYPSTRPARVSTSACATTLRIRFGSSFRM